MCVMEWKQQMYIIIILFIWIHRSHQCQLQYDLCQSFLEWLARIILKLVLTGSVYKFKCTGWYCKRSKSFKHLLYIYGRKNNIFYTNTFKFLYFHLYKGNKVSLNWIEQRACKMHATSKTFTWSLINTFETLIIFFISLYCCSKTKP